MNSEGLLAVTDHGNKCIHLVAKEGSLMRSIGKGVLSGTLGGIIFDLKGNVWVADWSHSKVLKLSQDGRLLQTIDVQVVKLTISTVLLLCPEGLIYICDRGNSVSLSMMKRACFCLLMDQREVALGVLIDLGM